MICFLRMIKRLHLREIWSLLLLLFTTVSYNGAAFLNNQALWKFEHFQKCRKWQVTLCVCECYCSCDSVKLSFCLPRLTLLHSTRPPSRSDGVCAGWDADLDDLVKLTCRQTSPMEYVDRGSQNLSLQLFFSTDQQLQHNKSLTRTSLLPKDDVSFGGIVAFRIILGLSGFDVRGIFP